MVDTTMPSLSQQSSMEDSVTMNDESMPSSVAPDDNEPSLAACIFTAQQQREHRLRTQRQRALKSVVKYNTSLNQQRVAERLNYFDLQTNLVHVPRRNVQVLPTTSELYQLQLADAKSGNGPFKKEGNIQKLSGDFFNKKTDAYPASLMFSPPQYSDHVPTFTGEELGYLPLSTAIHSAPPFALHCLNLSAEEFRKMRNLNEKNVEMSESDSDNESEKNNEKNSEKNSEKNNEKNTEKNSEKIFEKIFEKNSEKNSEKNIIGGEKNNVSFLLEKTEGDHVTVDGKKVVSAQTSPEKIDAFEASVFSPMEIPPCPADVCFNCHVRSFHPGPPAPPAPLPSTELPKNTPKRKRNKRILPELTFSDLAKEKLISCSKCPKKLHPSCMQLSKSTLFSMQNYPWQCSDCKVCLKCNSAAREESLMFCDFCDRGYHNFCVGVQRIPHGRWLCAQCAVCSLCGATQPNLPGKRGRACIWQTDWDEDATGNVTAVRTLCYPCHKKRKGMKETEQDEEGDEDSNNMAEAD